MTTERIDIVVQERGSRVVRRELAQIGQSGREAAGGVQFLQQAIVSLGLAFGASQLVRMVDQFTLLQNRLRLVTEDSDNLRAVQDELFASAQRTRSVWESTVELYARVARNADTLGLSQRQLLDVTETISQAIRVSGSDAQSASAGVRQFGQALGSGVLRGDELNSVMENMPRLARAIADGLGVTIGELRKMGEEGRLTASSVIEALQKSAPKIAEEFAKLQPTISEALTTVSNSFLRFIGQMDQAAGLSAALAAAIIVLASNFDVLAGVAVSIGASLLIVSGAISGPLMAAMAALSTAVAANPLGVLATGVLAASIYLTTFQSALSVTADGLVNLGDVFAAVFSLLGDIAAPFVEWFQSAWVTTLAGVSLSFENWLGNTTDILSTVLTFATGVVNAFIGIWVGAYRTITKGWELFPDALKAIGIAAVNGLITAIDVGISSIVRGVGKLFDWLGGAFTAVGMENPWAGMFANFETGLKDLKIKAAPQVSSAFSQLGTIAASEFKTSMDFDYVGSSVDAIMKRAREIAGRRPKDQARILDIPGVPTVPATPGSGGAGRSGESGGGGGGVDRESDALRRQKDLLEEIKGPIDDYMRNTSALNDLLQKGSISLEEYRKKFVDLRVEYLESQTTLAAGLERTFLKLTQDAEDAATQIEDLIKNAFRGAEDALAKFVTTGKLDFSSLIDSMLEDLTRLVIRQQITGPLAAALGNVNWGATLGFATGGTGTVGPSGLGYATGGDFTVSGGSGVDSVPVSFMATPGERVSVTRPGEVEGSRSQVIQMVQVNVIGADKARVEERQEGDGSRIIDVIIDRARDAVATDIARGGSSVNQSLERRYGLNAAAGNRS